MSRLWNRFRAAITAGRSRAASWWGGLSRRERIHAVLLAVFAAGVVGHQLALVDWFVEDAAISFAFARNLVRGEGLVAFPGGERVEGYSNPTWVALLAVMQALWLDPFVAVKVVQVVFGLATLPPVYLAMREAAGKDSDAPLLATAFVAASAQFAIWGAAGLENSLLHLLMALAIWRMMVELRTYSVPWSALLWMLVALSRPEAILYAAIAGAWAMITSIHARRTLVPTLQWLALFFVPWTAYQAWHYWYFAWPFPNTYYAKLGEREFVHWIWNDKAWKWSRNFFHDTAQGYFLPIWLLGVIGDGRRRYAWVAGVFVYLALTLQLATDQRWLLAALLGSLWITFWLGLRGSEGHAPRSLMIGATVGALALIGASEVARYAFDFVPTALPADGLVANLLPAVVAAVAVLLPSISSGEKGAVARVVAVTSSLLAFAGWLVFRWGSAEIDLLTWSLPYLLAGLALALPVLGFGARGWQLRGLVWWMCCASTMFAVYVQWDWMKGYRWYAPAVVPGSLLFAFGADAFVQMVEQMFARVPMPEPTWRRYTAGGVAVAVGLVALQAVPNIVHTVFVATKPDTSPRGVLPRVKHVQKIRDRLHIDERVVDLDVDQGAHLWWSDFEMMDMAGLIDVPFAHQHYERAFLEEYMFEEMRPHYAHVHGQWATNSKIPTVPAWRKQYVEVPGYPAGPNEHIGSYVRRDLIVGPAWLHGAERTVAMESEILTFGPYVPSPPASGRIMYVEVGLAATKKRKKDSDNFRAVLFASRDGALAASWDLPPGYDWLYPKAWDATEVFVGKFNLTLPPSMAPGTYDLGLVLFDAEGLVIGAALGDARSVGAAARIGGEEGTVAIFAPGEVQYPGALTVTDPDARDAASDAAYEEALATAADGRCEDAERAWWRARMYRPADRTWAGQRAEAIGAAFAGCWARAADGAEPAEQVARLVRARRWDHRSEEYLSRARPLADALYAQGLALREYLDWEGAYRAFADAVAVDRSLSWARRYAEEARAFKLGIDDASLEQKRLEEEEKRKAARERREKAQKAKAPAPAPSPAATPAEELPPGGDQ